MNSQLLIFETVSGRVPLLVWVASSDEERRQGAAGLPSFGACGGLLLEGTGGGVLTMEGMHFALDAVLISAGDRVLGILELELGASPVPLPAFAEHVLELPRGTARALDIARGTRIRRGPFVRVEVLAVPIERSEFARRFVRTNRSGSDGAS